MQDDMKTQLLTKPPKQLLIQLSIPAVMGMFVIGLYPLMDGIFAGQIIGQVAMAACGVAMPLTYINSGIATLLGMGSASVLARALGKGDQRLVNKVMGNLIFWVLVCSAITTVGGLLLAPYFLDLVGATGEIKALGIRYLHIIFLGSVFVNFTQSANMVIRGEGLMKKAMLIMGLGAAMNIVLDPILMMALGDFAIEGAALATVLSQITQALVTYHYFRKQSQQVKIGPIRIEKELSGQVFAVGVSAMMMQLLFMIQQTLLYKMAFQYGGEMHGTLMAAAIRMYGFSFIPLWGMSQGLQPVVGTNFGAKRYDRVAASVRVFSWGGLLLAGFFWILALALPGQILQLFGVEASLIAQGVGYFRLFYMAFVLYGVMVMAVTFFQAIGDGKKASLIVLGRQLVAFVPLALLLPQWLGVAGVWLAQPLVDTVIILLGVWLMIKEIRKFPASA
ncbi:MATE family efflux transporter [Abiotrophia sp. HMSC24B09]|jgi:MATE efflux family protein|uniref:MATE family efflux transporter n=1 Tax=Abiotrophia sp. HMSC24B09 TaxID=1581061 RepID=UPI0008A299E7|nr:MATE family efflux transporter [Abiotrophia sp. HMSC24B09]OFS29533.1 MATE family efflux transporter [Abiotrophia sp. HMSC24B09]